MLWAKLEPFVFFGLLLVGWEILLPFTGLPRAIFPTPTRIAATLFAKNELLSDGILVTLSEVALGFPTGVALGGIIGTMIAYSRRAERILYPLAVWIKVTPVIAIAPLLTIWLGFGLESKVAVVALITFFPIVVSTAVGLRSVDPSLIDLLRSLSAREPQIFHKVRLPWSLPHLFSGLKVSIGLSVIGAVVAEWVGSFRGLGHVILQGITYFDPELMFAALLILAALGIALFGAIVFIERMVAPWATHLETST